MSIYKWLNERVDLDDMYTALLDRKVPGGLSWAHTLGSATLTVFIVQALTGIALAMYYAPSPDHAYDSVRFIQSSVISGPLLRGIHHWGASAMVVLVVAHMIRVFTMGAYKYPREANWMLGVVLFILTSAIATGVMLMRTERRLNDNGDELLRARLLAESGLQRAVGDRAALGLAADRKSVV